MTTTPFQKALLLTGAALLVCDLAACTPRVATRGNLLTQSKIAELQPETSLRADVQRVWGPPSAVSPFDDKTWYYIGEVVSQKGIFAPEVQERKVVKVHFDDMGAVTEVAMLDPAQAREIEYASRRTPTAGREFTAFEQFIGNLGRFNQNVDNKPGASIPK